MTHEGILPLCKPSGVTSFHMVALLRRLTGIRTIGHAGTLDPFARGVMLLLIGKPFTKLSSQFLHQDKSYLATITLGIETDTYDLDGTITKTNDLKPSFEQIQEALLHFQGTLLQTPPMFSAKKVQGKKLYQLARQGITIERTPVPVTLHTQFIEYQYPKLTLAIDCSKGTYIRSLAYDLGQRLGCGAHLSALTRTRSGNTHLADCCDGARLMEPGYNWTSFLKTT